MKWLYGDAWERFPIKEGEVWGTELGLVAVHNLFNPLPEFMCEADLLFIDPPWNLGNLNTFYTKAGRTDYRDSFAEFTDAVFARISEINPRTCYIEMGKQNVNVYENRLREMFPVVQRWQVTYYRRSPCFILRGSDSHTRRDYTGMDETDVIREMADTEDYQVAGDFVMGRGLVGLAAHDSGNRFVGTELNPRRLACLLDGLAKRGANVRKLASYPLDNMEREKTETP